MAPIETTKYKSNKYDIQADNEEKMPGSGPQKSKLMILILISILATSIAGAFFYIREVQLEVRSTHKERQSAIIYEIRVLTKMNKFSILLSHQTIFLSLVIKFFFSFKIYRR